MTEEGNPYFPVGDGLGRQCSEPIRSGERRQPVGRVRDPTFPATCGTNASTTLSSITNRYCSRSIINSSHNVLLPSVYASRTSSIGIPWRAGIDSKDNEWTKLWNTVWAENGTGEPLTNYRVYGLSQAYTLVMALQAAEWIANDHNARVCGGRLKRRLTPGRSTLR